jgi:CRISPR-associated protein Cas8b/Csh1 subtype I-B
LSFTKRHLFTFKIDGKYFGDFPENKKLFIDDAYQKYYKGSSATHKLCSVTNEIADEVWGRVDTLGFTVNDVAFSRNGFNDRDSYKMFPVSPEAVKILEGTKRIIITSDKSLTRNFYGMKYFVLPRFIFEDEELIKDTMSFFFRERPANEGMKEVGESLINGERYLKEIAEEPNQFKGVYFDLFFFEPNNAQFMIKLHLSDVIPSRIVNIFKAKATVEKRYEKLNRIKINSKAQGEEKTIWNYHITFGGLLEKKMPPMYGIKDYFSEKVKTNIVFHPIFFEILEAVFQNQKLNRISVLTAFMHKITTAFKNTHEYPEDLDRHVKATFTIYQFFNELQLFNPTAMEEKPTQELELTEEGLLTPDNFVSSHANYFTEKEPAKKGAFYLGCMTTKMMEMQRKYYDMESNYSAPIAKHLQSLNFGEQDLRKLFSKLEDYKKYSSRMTTESGRNKLTKFDFDDIEVLQLQAGMNLTNISDLPRVELSYAFTLGMTIQRESTKAAIAKGLKEKKKREKQQSTK